MPKDTSIKSVLIIGSGPIVIGQACEFDYAGSQSARSLKEEGIEVILINSNPATIMTDPSMADHVYLLPLTTKSIIQILKNHPNIDAVLPTMGGQTALNLCLEAEDKGIWKEHNVRLIGVDVAAINITEDREQFKQLLQKIGVGAAPAKIATSFLKGKEIAQEFGFPLVIRPSFTLGGTGAAFVHNKEEFDDLLTRGIEITDVNAAMFDPANHFHGCIPGIHEILRRQGLLEGTWCLNPKEQMSAGQNEEISRVYAAYPHLHDDAFVNEFLQSQKALQ